LFGNSIINKIERGNSEFNSSFNNRHKGISELGTSLARGSAYVYYQLSYKPY